MSMSAVRSARCAAISCVLAAMLNARHSTLLAQGPTTAAIGGRVTDAAGRSVTLAEITVINRATGTSTRSLSRTDGRYLVGSLEPGGPYSLTIRRLGSPMQRHDSLYLNLGQRMELDIQLDEQPIMLQGMNTVATTSRIFSRARMGTEALISQSTIRDMPIVNRDLYDLVRLVPQISTLQALSAAGASPRATNIRIDGFTDLTLFGAVPAGSVLGGKSIPLDAVSEYQVLLSPYDVRQGNFSGAAINAVTRHGTNDVRGEAFVYGANERLGRDVAFIRDARYEKTQFGFWLGGPIIRDRLHFFIAPELQHRLIPAIGPYVGQDASSETPLPADTADLTRFQRILSGYALDGGSAGAVNNRNPASNVFVRLDAHLRSWNSRVVLRGNYTRADSFVFARPTPAPSSNCPTAACFPLSSLRQQRWFRKKSLAAKLYTTFANGASNELMLGHLATPSSIGPTVKQPLVMVTVRGRNGQPAVLQSGTHEISTADSTGNWTTEVTDNLSIPVGSHLITLGATAQLLKVRRFDLRGAYGVWEFASLDSLESGRAARYRIARNSGTADVSVSAHHLSVYLGDEWDATERLALTFGIRADMPTLVGNPPYNAAVDSLLHRRTDRVPTRQVQWSPRVGFNIDASGAGDRSTQLRGGVGMFMGRAPLGWLFDSFANYGVATPMLRCGTLPSDAGPPPRFQPDYADQPIACANRQGAGAPTVGEIDLLDAHFRHPQVLRASLAADRQLPFGLVATLEGLYTQGVRTVFFTAANLTEPSTTDRHGRVLYGSVAPTGSAAPNRITSRFGDVISVGNQSRDYTFDISSELQRSFAERGELRVSVTHSRARDVQSQRIVRPVLLDNWRYGRTVAGRHEETAVGISDFDQPFRVRASGTVRTRVHRWRSEFSFYYVGGSGLPHTYVAGGAGRGDLNADGALGNDPIYIPRTAFDTAEIQFAGSLTEVAAQQLAFEEFVEDAPCLDRQRGRIMARNSCRSPWIHFTNVAMRQSVPVPRGERATVELQIFNVLNLLNARWGRVQLPTSATPAVTTQLPLLSQVGQTPGPASSSQPIYRFDTTMRRYSVQNVDSYYQLQLGARFAL